jgi:hypothetical protein
VIEATRRLGGAAVQGWVTPDHYRVSPARGELEAAVDGSRRRSVALGLGARPLGLAGHVPQLGGGHPHDLVTREATSWLAPLTALLEDRADPLGDHRGDEAAHGRLQAVAGFRGAAARRRTPSEGLLALHDLESFSRIGVSGG